MKTIVTLISMLACSVLAKPISVKALDAMMTVVPHIPFPVDDVVWAAYQP